MGKYALSTGQSKLAMSGGCNLSSRRGYCGRGCRLLLEEVVWDTDDENSISASAPALVGCWCTHRPYSRELTNPACHGYTGQVTLSTLDSESTVRS